MFAKYWEAGKVKTRLAHSIGDEAARNLYRLFVEVLLENFRTFGDLANTCHQPTRKI